MIDVVYFWQGGTENGVWNEAMPGVWPSYKDAETLVWELERMGYVAHAGSRSVGPPEGPPSQKES